MGKLRNARAKIEFGDFQTPPDLASAVCRALAATGVAPRSLIEPTCGEGSLLLAALDAFPTLRQAHGLEINPTHVDHLRARLAERRLGARVDITCASFFDHDWPNHLEKLAEPLLVLGNPPWVTSADLGSLGSDNLPTKTNLRNLPGIEALTGKSNFDISEWIFNYLLTRLDGRRATMAMLCKTAVARKVLASAWSADLRIHAACLRRIDSARHFAASVDACLTIIELAGRAGPQVCPVYPDLEATTPESALAVRDGRLIADATLYDRRRALLGASPYKWRSGVKHDCAALMEFFNNADGRLQNGAGETPQLEQRCLYPLIKSSDLARAGAASPRRWLLVTQSRVGEDTTIIKNTATNTWRYLQRHRERFDRRASAIYRGKPPFAIFGVGDYTFAPWKVAISGLYKTLKFRKIGPHAGKPVVLDDTCYFVACTSEPEADLLIVLLDSEAAHEFYRAFIFWDSKRPITADLLDRLDLRALAAELGLAEELARLRPPAREPGSDCHIGQSSGASRRTTATRAVSTAGAGGELVE